jgi:hypothetical protein
MSEETNKTDPKIESIAEDSATQGFFWGIKLTRNYVIFLCVFMFSLVIFEKLDFSRLKDVSSETMKFVYLLLEGANFTILSIFFMLVGSYVFKGKGGSKFFESLGNLIDKLAGFYKAKASAKIGMNLDKKEEGKN